MKQTHNKMTQFKYLQFKLIDNVAWLTLFRPQALNALHSDMIAELKHFALELVKQNPYALVIQGSGKAFCVGADIKEMSGFNHTQALAFAKAGQSSFSLIEDLPFPVVSAIHGFALGGGLELALSSDVILTTENAKLALPEVSLGLIPAFGGTQRLSRAVGLYRAKEMILSGRVYSAQQALSLGVVNHIYPDQKTLMSSVMALINDIKKRDPKAVSVAKKLTHQLDTQTLHNRLEKEALAFSTLFKTSGGAKQGMQNFLAKKK